MDNQAVRLLEPAKEDMRGLDRLRRPLRNGAEESAGRGSRPTSHLGAATTHHL
jgi:hypothetical protein